MWYDNKTHQTLLIEQESTNKPLTGILVFQSTYITNRVIQGEIPQNLAIPADTQFSVESSLSTSHLDDEMINAQKGPCLQTKIFHLCYRKPSNAVLYITLVVLNNMIKSRYHLVAMNSQKRLYLETELQGILLHNQTQLCLGRMPLIKLKYKGTQYLLETYLHPNCTWAISL